MANKRSYAGVQTYSPSRKAITASLPAFYRWRAGQGHIISVDGQPAVIAALTIVPNVNMSLLKGTPNLLLSITYIDEAFISEIGRSLLLNDLGLFHRQPVATVWFLRLLSSMTGPVPDF